MTTLNSPPGVVATPTKARSSLNWSDANLIRWERDRLTPVGGWSRLAYTATASNVRRVFQWRDNSDTNWTAILCDAHLYVEYEGDLVDITPVGGIAAPSTSFVSGGYGDDSYSDGSFGTPRPDQPNEKSVGFAFTLDNWGQDLLAMTSVDGRLLRWDPTTLPTGKAEVVPNAPVSNRSFVVTPERHVILFDAGGVAGEFAWCDQEDIENWDFADVDSKAGTLPLEPRAKGVAARHIPGGTISFTTRAVHFISFTGMPYIYGADNIGGSSVTPISDRCLVETDAGAVWLSESGVWGSSGLSVARVDCKVWDKIKNSVNWFVARFTASATVIEDRTEIWFCLPTGDSTKNNMVVIYNYVDNWWSLGRLSRSAGASSTYTTYPIMADDTVLYQHETGNRMDDAPEKPWVESYAIQTGDGSQMTIQQLEPDVEGDFSDVRYVFKFRDHLAGGDEEYSTDPIRVYDGFVDVQETGRDFRVRIECTGDVVGNWTIGDSQLHAVKRGKRSA